MLKVILSREPNARIQRGGRGSGPPPPLENHKAIAFLINTGLDPMENHKTTKTVFNFGPSSARQETPFHRPASETTFHRPASKTPFKCPFAGGPVDGPLLVVFGSSLPSSTKKKKKKKQCQSWTPSDKTFRIRASRLFCVP